MRGYLVLKDRLLQVWLNKTTISSSILVIKVTLFCYLLSHFLTVSENLILSSCEDINNTLDSVANGLPQYLSTIGNYMVKKSMEESIDKSLAVVSLLVTASEELLTFFIELYLGTYACLVVSAIDGTVDVAVNTTEHIIGFVNETVSDMANTLDDGLNGLSKVINTILSTANKIENLLKGSSSSVDDDIHKVNLTSAKLRHFSIPSTINYKLQRLSEEVPSFDQLKNETKTLIDIPFEHVRKKLDNIDPRSILPSDQNLLYTPDTVVRNGTLASNICSEIIPEIQEVFKRINSIIKTAFILILVIGTMVVIGTTIPQAYAEYKLWKRLNQMQDKLDRYVEDKYFLLSEDDSSIGSTDNVDNNKFDIIESYYNVFDAWPAKTAKILTKSNQSSSTNRKKFFIHFVLSTRARSVLLISILGILVCGIQFGILHAIDRHVTLTPSLINNIELSQQLSKSAESQARLWSDAVNLYTNETELNINREVFGWVQNTTSLINSTIVITMDKIDTTLADIFNGTLLYGPMRTVVYCAIERKLISIEQAMTWVNRNARIKIPKINSTDITHLVAATPQQLSGSVYEAKKITHYIKNITAVARRTTFFELYVSLALLAIWLLQIPTALILIYLGN